MADDRISIRLTFNRGDPVYDLLAEMRGDPLALRRYTHSMCNYAAMMQRQSAAGSNVVASAAPMPAVPQPSKHGGDGNNNAGRAGKEPKRDLPDMNLGAL